MYRKRVLICRVFGLSCLFALMNGIIMADVRKSVADEFDRFVLMSEKEKTMYIAQSFEKRVRHVDNLSYRLDTGIGYRKFGVPNSEIVNSRYTIEHKILGVSYTMKIDAPPGARDREHGYHQIISIFFDGEKGVTKNYVNAPPNIPGVFWGRIDAEADSIVRKNHYTSWLSGNFQTTFHLEDYFLFPCLLRHKDEWGVEIDNTKKVVKLYSPYPQMFVADKFDGTRELILDPQKGFMPISGKYRWESTLQNYNDWFEEGFVVEDSILVGDVWMPVKMMSYHRLPSSPEYETFFRMNVTDITHGQVTKADMHLEFPEGTAVVDAINGISYKTDASYNAIESTIEPLYDVDPSQVKMPPQQKEKYTIINYTLMAVGIAMILWALYTMIQKRRNDS